MFRLVLLIWVSVVRVETFSRFFGRCRVDDRDLDPSQLPFEYVMTSRHVKQSLTVIPNITLNYTSINLINYRYIDAGASGEVFLMQSPITSKLYIAKRFFKQGRFHEEDFIMKNLGYDIQWTCDPYYNNTIALYPHSNARNIDQVWITQEQARVISYKIALQLYKAHQLGVMHMDIKPQNIIVDVITNPDGQKTTRKSQTTIIDWNLANPYYIGAHYPFRRGTPCTMSPQLIIWAQHYTPAVDVWSLGITIIRMITGEKIIEGCVKNSLEAMVRFIGYQQFKRLYDKLRVQTDEYIIEVMNMNIDAPGYIQDILEQEHDDGITVSCRSMLRQMLRVDPEERITFEQLLQDDYFKNVVGLPPPKYQKEKHKKKHRRHHNESK